MDGNATLLRYTAVAANINCAAGTASNVNSVLTFTLPNSLPSQAVSLGVSGVVAAVAGSPVLVFGPAYATNANTVKCVVSNPSNVAVAATNVTLEITLFIPSGATSGTATVALGATP